MAAPWVTISKSKTSALKGQINQSINIAHYIQLHIPLKILSILP
jgi:hypothetical protein